MHNRITYGLQLQFVVGDGVVLLRFPIRSIAIRRSLLTHFFAISFTRSNSWVVQIYMYPWTRCNKNQINECTAGTQGTKANMTREKKVLQISLENCIIFFVALHWVKWTFKPFSTMLQYAVKKSVQNCFFTLLHRVDFTLFCMICHDKLKVPLQQQEKKQKKKIDNGNDYSQRNHYLAQE